MKSAPNPVHLPGGLNERSYSQWAPIETNMADTASQRDNNNGTDESTQHAKRRKSEKGGGGGGGGGDGTASESVLSGFKTTTVLRDSAREKNIFIHGQVALMYFSSWLKPYLLSIVHACTQIHLSQSQRCSLAQSTALNDCSSCCIAITMFPPNLSWMTRRLSSFWKRLPSQRTPCLSCSTAPGWSWRWEMISTALINYNLLLIWMVLLSKTRVPRTSLSVTLQNKAPQS